MSNTNKPLTAEEMIVPHSHWIEGWGRMVFSGNAEDIAIRYADKQNAAVLSAAKIVEDANDNLRKETAALREELSRIMELCGVQHVNGEGGALVAVGYALKELKELAAWKKSQLETFGPLIDFGQSKESGIPIGASIVQEAINALKERKSLRDELERAKERIDYYREAADKKDVTIQELERSIAKHAPIEAKAIRERDEAVRLLGKAHDLIEGDLHEFMTREERATCMDIRQGFERLSSGESKPEPVNVLETLSRISPERSKQSFGLEVTDWSLTDWACALSGEVGELCNFVKKQRRDGEDRTRDIAKEAADVAIYLDLFCTRARINLQQAIIAKFNETSDKRGCAIKIPEE